jgi:UDP-N-acetylmuramoyl-L-alanyl-D-glutamate--2,6-diaminopimelate ligase
MLNYLRKLISLDNPVRLAYHKARAILASVYYGFPAKDMTIVWVTGTNGKTTTCNIIAKWLKASGKKVFMFTTVNIIIWDKEYVNDSKMTSPDVFLLQRLLKAAKEEKCEIAIIETASHGILMSRTRGLQYDVVVLTNITQDHLDLHWTMKEYVNTKLKIFKELITYKRKPWVKKSAVINVNSDYSELFREQTYDSMYLYGIGKWASLTAENIKFDKEFTSFDVKITWKPTEIKTTLKWNFNIENILAAIWVFMSFWIEEKDIKKVIAEISWVPGRMESVENNLGLEIIVDYAHTPDALEKVLTTISDVWYNRIITIFGATGDRDRTKRPIMWEIVSKYSDMVILTQDDDYTEKTEKIIKDVLPGINREEWESFYIIPTRKEAIEVWIAAARVWDVLLIAGKWDEHLMMTNAWPVKWHDKSIIKGILEKIDDNVIIE